MKEFIFALAITAIAPCMATTTQAPKSQTSQVAKCSKEKIYVYSDDITILGDSILVLVEGELCVTTKLCSDLDGIYVKAQDLLSIVTEEFDDTACADTYDGYWNQ